MKTARIPPGASRCRRCSGTGEVHFSPSHTEHDCSVCRGRGWVTFDPAVDLGEPRSILHALDAGKATPAPKGTITAREARLELRARLLEASALEYMEGNGPLAALLREASDALKEAT